MKQVAVRYRRIWIFLSSLFLLILFLLLTLSYLIFSDPPHSHSRQESYFFGDLKANLMQGERDGVIRHPRLILGLLRLGGMDRMIHSGVYEFDSSMSDFTVLKKLVKGEIKKVSLTVVEGFDLYDIEKLLLENQLIHQEGQFIRISRSARAKSLIFKPLLEESPGLKDQLNSLPSIEGFIYPDTYQVTLTKPLEELLRLAGQNFKTKIFPLIDRNSIAVMVSGEKRSWADLFTIASLIEKETIVEAEKPLVASVVYNRLARRMKLRFDPTIIYALKKMDLYQLNLREGKINIKREHFTLPSAYNTYYQKKLPPSPISSFRIASLRAALNPAISDYLFFVAQKKGVPQAGHYFSRTYAEHKARIFRTN